MPNDTRLETTELSREECETLLRAERIGRIAYSFHDQVDIQPILFAYRDGWIFGRTAEGAKLATIRHNRWSALQADRIQDLWNWESVVVRGSIHLLGEGDGPGRRDLEKAARRALSEVAPETFGAEDPAPERTIVFGLSPNEIVGRRARLATRD